MIWRPHHADAFNVHKNRVDLDAADCEWLLFVLNRGSTAAQSSSITLHQRLSRLADEGWLEYGPERQSYYPTEALKRNREGIETLLAMYQEET